AEVEHLPRTRRHTSSIKGDRIHCEVFPGSRSIAYRHRGAKEITVLEGKMVVVVLPAYKAELTLERTYKSIPSEIVDTVLLVDDASTDGTVQRARELGIMTFVH